MSLIQEEILDNRKEFQPAIKFLLDLTTVHEPNFILGRDWIFSAVTGKVLL